MRQIDVPLLRNVVDQGIESVLPCTDHQRRALRAGGLSVYQSVLFEVQAQDGNTVVMERLQHAWQEVVRRHSILRTVFAMGSKPLDIYQVIIKNLVPAFENVHLDKVDDLRAEVEQKELPVLRPHAPMHLIQVFSNSRDAPLLRFCYSSTIIGNDLFKIQADLVQQYLSFTLRANPNAMLASQEGKKVQAYLLERVKSAEPTIIGNASTTSIEPKTTNMKYTNMSMPESIGKVLLQRCSDDGVAPLNIVQALWLILLAKFLNLDQPCCSYTTTSDCPQVNVHGGSHFPSQLALCTAHIADDDQVMDVIKELYKQTLEDANHKPETLPSTMHNGKRVFNSTINWFHYEAGQDGQDHFHLEPIASIGVAEIDVNFTLVYSGKTLAGYLQTSCAVENWLAKSIAGMFVQSLEYILRYPSCKVKDIPRCSPSDIEMIQQWNGGTLQKRDSCIHDLVREQARLRPEAPAIVAYDGSLSYRGFDALTNQLASVFITKFGFKSEEKILLAFPHSIWAIVAMFAVMKAGSAFVPMDEDTPVDRIKSIARKVNARFIITSELIAKSHEILGLEAIVLDQSFVDTQLSPAGQANPSVSPSNLAYVIFTSGSTGEPKGCAIEHGAFCSSALAYGPALRLGTNSRVLQFSSYAFDASLVDILVGLLCGSCICVPSDHERMNDIGRAASQLQANWAMLTPSLVSRINIESATCIKTLIMVGEPLTSDVRDAWAPRVDLFGGYGPSEVGPISAVVGPLTIESHPTNLGPPVGNKSWVVDKSDHDQLVPVGAIGELVLEGHSLGRGYVGDEEKTRQVFIQDPEWTKWPEFRQGAETRRMYKTGDLVIRCGDGTLQYIGRKDMQVKIRGQRMELGDVESHLKAIVGVDLAVETGIPRGCQQNEKMLVAFVCLGSTVPDDLSAVDTPAQARLHELTGNVEDKLSSKLSRYMLPDAYLPLHTLPITVSDKRDRRKLQQLIASLSKQQLLAWASTASAGRPLLTEMDWQVARLWAIVLKIEAAELSLDDDFVKRGGDSLAAMRLANMCKEEGLKLSFRDIYRKSRILGDQVAFCTHAATRGGVKKV